MIELFFSACFIFFVIAMIAVAYKICRAPTHDEIIEDTERRDGGHWYYDFAQDKYRDRDSLRFKDNSKK